MRRAWPILLVLLSLAGCGPARYEEVAREQTDLNEELAREWAGVADEATMKAAYPKLVEQYRRVVALNREAKGLTKPSAAVNDELSEKYGPRMQAAVNKILTEQQRIHALPGGGEFLQKVKEGFKTGRGGASLPRS
jgi:hypothetical protein